MSPFNTRLGQENRIPVAIAAFNDPPGAGNTEGFGPFYLHPDHLDTPRLVTDVANQVLWRWDHGEPFGNSPENSNPSGLGFFGINYRFPGQYLDRASNTHYNYFRDYDPGIGRYPQFDSIGLRGGINGYVYAYDNPLRYVDPNGLIGGDVFGFAEGGGLGFGGAIPFGKPGAGIGGAFGIEMRPCCGDDDLIYTEFVLVARGGPSFGGSGRVSPAGALTVARVGQLPRCLAETSFEAGLISIDIQVLGGTFAGDLRNSRVEVGVTGGAGASGVLNVLSYTRPLRKTPTGRDCNCDRPQ